MIVPIHVVPTILSTMDTFETPTKHNAMLAIAF
jgi:hypothetical protein